MINLDKYPYEHIISPVNHELFNHHLPYYCSNSSGPCTFGPFFSWAGFEKLVDR